MFWLVWVLTLGSIINRPRYTNLLPCIRKKEKGSSNTCDGVPYSVGVIKIINMRGQFYGAHKTEGTFWDNTSRHAYLRYLLIFTQGRRTLSDNWIVKLLTRQVNPATAHSKNNFNGGFFLFSDRECEAVTNHTSLAYQWFISNFDYKKFLCGTYLLNSFTSSKEWSRTKPPKSRDELA